ncbi:hypothetical protein MYSTI_02111 [Myxococcus stipitatus DSM 14675]|uniref:Peptidase M12A domain-containing protein n=1 Tax=Myxococcus stipitatus (strain DSM 14675 / JCM 12634 / Mx s8) TaxID=1278073 RepID=L7U6I5_MYXSD|nr:M12 family metallopeptidase [Myxococcus stipitatus]AGC43440.1 hypothetical protein MYSTI_02111 [Myxococcus stipitatus DSM 14675]
MKTRQGLLLLASVLTGFSAQAAAWNGGTHDTTPSVCFVGNALTARPDRVQQVLDYIEDFERAANIRFTYMGTCPAPVVLANGTEWHSGDIRIVLWGTNTSPFGQVPGVGCRMFLDENGNYTGENDGGSSWSNFPGSLAENRSCRYNLKLGDDADALGVPWRDHTLHEFGHALGLVHEHERDDADAAVACGSGGFGGDISTAHLTVYDRYSVMNYRFLACGINGNYGHAGLSALDRLGMHILYPEPTPVAELWGRTVIQTTESLSLMSAWAARGADIGFTAPWFQWTLSGVTVSSTSTLNGSLQAGTYPLQLSYQDFRGRMYSYSGTVKVLTPADYARRIVSPIATLSPLM